jgi:hypothetical protein
MIYKENTAKNCITVKSKKSFIFVNFDGSYYGSSYQNSFEGSG